MKAHAMSVRRLIRNGWFWAATALALVSIGVIAYTVLLRDESDRLARDQLAAWRQFVEILDSVRMPDDMDVAWTRVVAHQEQERGLEARARALPRPSAQLRQELGQRYGSQFEDVLRAYRARVEEIKKLPGGQGFLDKVERLTPDARGTVILGVETP